MPSPYGSYGLATASGHEVPLNGISPSPSSTSDTKNFKVQDPNDRHVHRLLASYAASCVLCHMQF